MAEKEKKDYKKYVCKNHNHGGGSAVYGLGFVGAAIYFIQHAETFGAGVLGILKAIVWPAFLIYKALEVFGF